jgi:uncharacterized protein (TIGR03000 family)
MIARSPVVVVLAVLAAGGPAAASSHDAKPRSAVRAASVQGQAAAPARPAGVRTRFNVIVPQDDAIVRMQEMVVAGTGRVREVETPPLERGRNYTYTLTAEWRPNSYTVITRNKSVEFRGGDRITVDLTVDDPNDRARVRYVPTPDHVVSAMIDLAGIGPSDVVYEPGCGDARITIAAVMAGARRGVGIDIDAERVSDSQRRVKEAGLANRIDIRLGDALDIKDLSEATVVFLYMGDEFNKLIRPILWRQLKVGTRVVSHRFTMGDWKPDRTVDVEENAEGVSSPQVHLWTITDEIKRRAAKE